VSEPNVHFLIPMARVKDVQKSMEFYKKLGFEPVHVGRADNGHCYWAHLRSGKAHLMLSSFEEGVDAEKQGVLFYMYAEKMVELREDLMSKDVKVSDITYPFYMPKGEVCVNDIDGYMILIGQSD
jgi:hypothetical protein